MRNSFCWAVLAALSAGAAAEESPAVVKHVMVYHEPGRFGGWPANHGMWSWGNEILVGFSRGYYKDLGERHNIDRDKPEEHCLARSLDGGETWTVEHPNEKGYLLPQGDALHGTELPGVPLKEVVEFTGQIDFTHPDFCMAWRMNDHHKGPSRFYYSYDRGKTWEGPFRVPDMGTAGVGARTDYIVNGKHDCHVFLTAAKPGDLREGRPFCARTTDGGRTWEFQGWIGPEPAGYAIMPASVRLSPTDILSIIRRREQPEDRPAWTEAWLSNDNGKTWTFLNKPSEDLGTGNPAALIKLKDGRLCYTYGVRKDPFRIGAKLSSDGGRTWSEEIVLRDNLGGTDLGYSRTIQRPDGIVVTTYYAWDKQTGPERYIEATLWDPSKAE